MSRSNISISDLNFRQEIPRGQGGPVVDLARMLASGDLNFDGRLDLAEFHDLPELAALSRTERRELFARLDADRDGSLAPQDDLDGDAHLSMRDVLMFLLGERAHEPYGQNAAVNRKLRAAIRAQKKLTERRFDSILERTTDLDDGVCLYQYVVPIFKLPAAMAGTTILHLSDLHLAKDRPEQLAKVEMAARLGLKPDLVILTGDLVDESLDCLDAQARKIFRELCPGALKLFVLGNHDYLAGKSSEVQGWLKALGWYDITGRNCRVKFGGQALNICGVDDALRGKPQVPVFADNAILEPRILVTHNLDALNNSLGRGIDLILSGHLHSGEINLLFADGIDFMRLFGAYKNRHRQKSPWKALTPRTLSYISPGLFTRLGLRVNTAVEGITLHVLTPFSYEQADTPKQPPA